MLTVISPAKSLDLAPVGTAPTEPVWQDDAVRLAKTMRGQTLGQMRRLMGISADLARLSRDRFKVFADNPVTAQTKPAALAFNGDTYQGLEAKTLDPDDLVWAQDHLRILSGLYGLLRPLDAIQPYRLEMGSRLKTRRGETLYDYWGDRIAKALMAQAAVLETDTLVNCASQEYFAAAARKPLKMNVITPMFYELRDAKPQMISFFAKRARGAMARFIVTNRLTDPEAIRGFTAGGYAFDPDLSEDDRWAFVRPYPETPAVGKT